MAPRRIGSGHPLELQVGYCRAVLPRWLVEIEADAILPDTPR